MKPQPPPGRQLPVTAAFALVEQKQPAGNHAAWLVVLDDLSDQLGLLRACVHDDTRLMELPDTPWMAPVALGPLPDVLAPRAAALVDEMDVLRAGLLTRREETSRQLRAVESVPRDTSPTSVYLDSVG